MTREESAQLLTNLVNEYDTFSANLQKDSGYLAFVERYDAASDEDKPKVVKESEVYIQEKIDKELTKVSPNVAREILVNVSQGLIEEFAIPRDTNFGMSTFDNIVISLIDSVKDDTDLINSLLSNEEFMNTFIYVSPVTEKVLSYADSKEAVYNFIRFFSNNCKSGTEEKQFNYINQLLSKYVGIILKSDKFDNEFKESFLNDPELIPFYDMNYLFKEISTSNLSREKKLSYLTNPKYKGEANSYGYTLAIMELCKTKEDYLSIINNEEIVDKVDLATLLASCKLPSDDIKELFFNPIVQEHMESYQVSRFIEEVDTDYETRRSILFDERIAPLINATFLKNILESRHLTTEQRMELLLDDRIYKHIHDTYDFDGIIPTLLKSKNVPLEDKIAIAKDNRFNSEIDSTDMRRIFSDPSISIETANELLLNKRLFYKIIGEYHEEYNPNRYAKKGPFKYDKYEFLLQLMERNPYIAKTISYKIFNDDVIDLGIDFIDRLSRDAKLSDVFANNYSENQPIRRLYIKHAIESILNSSYKDDIDLSEFISRIVDSTFDHRQEDMDELTGTSIERKIVKIRNDSHLKYDELTKENWKTLTEIALRDISPYIKGVKVDFVSMFRYPPDPRLNILPDVDTNEDLDNYEERRRALCDEIFNKSLEAKDLESAKNAFFNKYYSINIEEAIEIVKLYGPTIEEFSDNPEYASQVNYIRKIKRALEIGRLEAIKYEYETTTTPLSFDESIYMDQSIKRMFSKDISDSVYKVQGEQTEIEVNGRKVKVYEPGYNFKMLVHSTDAYGKLELINNNYDDSWNKSSRTTNHGICCSLIANSNIGIAEVKDVLFGFDGWDPRSIPKMAPYDIYSVNDSYDLQEGRKMIFMTADEIINNTRHAHNEMVLERRELRKDKANPLKPNIQPSYVIIYSDMTDDIKEKAIKCSNEMNIPIVYLDKEKISNHEVAKIDSKIQEIKDCHDLDGKINILKDVLLIHENNRSGYRISNKDWLEEKFPTEKIDKVIKQLILEIKLVYDTTGDIVTYYRQSEMLMRLLDNENQKFITTEENSKRKHTIDLPIDEYKLDLMQHINPNIGKTSTPLLEYIVDKLEKRKEEDKLSRALTSLDKNNIHKQIEELQSYGLYQYAGRSHNIGHIERVLAFSTLIGRKELRGEDGSLDEHAMDLLTKAAIYHDCGRESDHEDKNHGLRSSMISEELLRKDGYSEEDIKIIKVAIEYHEIDDDDLRFERLCARNGLDPHNVEYAKKIAICLKDADALDRTRFINRATLDPTKLRTNEAKDLVTLATDLNAEYRNAGRELFMDSCKEIMMQGMEKEASTGGMQSEGVQR